MSVEYKTDLPHVEAASTGKPSRKVMDAVTRGFMHRCPSCGTGHLFSRFLKTVHSCDACGEEIHHHRADDAPPYFTITIVGHIIIPALLAVEIYYRPEIWVHMAIWLPLTLILSLGMLQPIKGALVGLQWALYMHGFDPETEEDLPEADPAASMR